MAFGEETVTAAELTRGSVDPADAFALWIRPHWDDLNRLARRLCGVDCADDVVQESAECGLAVSLYYYLGLLVGEISAVMSCSPGTVKSTLSDARRLLRVSLGDEYA